MINNQLSQIYTSIDLELTGFDPEKDEIIEVGFTKFKLGESGAEVVSSWQSVFQPTKTVRHKILGLTGITESELESAPKFSEHRDFIAGEIKNTVLVGHGLTLDIRFLEADGVTVPSTAIDTLDLAQWILPTYHSYNLESLMHLFSIKHLEAHRALADSQAVIELLSRLLGVQQTFPIELKNRIQHLLKHSSFSWQALLDIAVPKADYPVVHKKSAEAASNNNVQISGNSIMHLPLDLQLSDDDLARTLVGTPTVLALAHKQAVMQLWQTGLVEPMFAADDLFDQTKFESLVRTDVSNPELVKFLLKVAVWYALNWQRYTVLDLNLSFFGGQFKALIAGGQQQISDTKLVLALDHYTFLKGGLALSSPKRLVVKDLLAFEEAAAASFGARVSWGGMLARLRGIYNPETETGNLALRDQVMTALAATDLFFSLVVLELSRRFHGQDAISLNTLETSQPVSFGKLTQAAENFLQKLKPFTIIDSGLASLSDSVRLFFALGRTEMKWIEFNQKHCVFFIEPLEFKSRITQLIKNFQSVTLVESIHSERLRDYLVERLGLESLTKVRASHQAVRKVPVTVSHDDFWSDQILPAIVLFPNIDEVKAYYDANYRNLKRLGVVYAEKYSGGTNKLLRNYGIRENSVLLVSAPGFARMARIQVRAHTLIVAGLPKPPMHPHQEALRGFWQERFAEFAEIEATKLLQRALEHMDVNQLQRCLVVAHNDQESQAIIQLLTSFEFFG